jgi:hypothetical protein
MSHTRRWRQRAERGGVEAPGVGLSRSPNSRMIRRLDRLNQPERTESPGAGTKQVQGFRPRHLRFPTPSPRAGATCALLHRRASRRLGENDAWLVATAESINADVVAADRVRATRLTLPPFSLGTSSPDRGTDESSDRGAQETRSPMRGGTIRKPSAHYSLGSATLARTPRRSRRWIAIDGRADCSQQPYGQPADRSRPCWGNFRGQGRFRDWWMMTHVAAC